MRRQVVFLVFAFVAVISAAPAQNNTTQASDPANTAEVKTDEPKQDADTLQDEALMNKELGDDFLKADALEDEDFMKNVFQNEVFNGNAFEEDEFKMECEDDMLMLMLFDLDEEDKAASV